MTRLATYITEEQIYNSISYDLYTKALDYLFTEEYTEQGLSLILNEGISDWMGAVKDAALEKMSVAFGSIKSEIMKIADDLGIGIKDVLNAFKSGTIFDLLKALHFNLVVLLKAINALSGLVRQGLFSIFKDIAKTGAFQKIQKGVMRVDELFDKYPILRKVTGPVVAGLLFYMWTQMTFIGNLDYDFDFTSIMQALQGKYTLADLFASPQGLMMATLFTTGGLISVPWLGATTYNLVLALVYTGYKYYSGSDNSILKKLHQRIRT